MLEDEPAPEQYLQKLPPKFNPGEVMDLLTDTDWSMNYPEDRRAFMEWIKAHETLFPDVALAQTVIANNRTWGTDSEEDMEAFFAAIGFPRTDPMCPRCYGSGEEPGAPRDEDAEGNELFARCARCQGTGVVKLPTQLT